jgi:hypothetical protein
MVGHISSQGRKQVHCIRPYAPEIAGTLSDWGAGIWSTADGRDHVVRSEMGTPPFSSGTTLTSEQIVNSIPNVKFAFPIPPGQTSGQPWFIPECGYGPEALDASKDPENARAPMYPKAFVDRYSPSRGDTGRNP